MVDKKTIDVQYLIVTSSGLNINMYPRRDLQAPNNQINDKKDLKGGDLSGVNYDPYIIQNELLNVKEFRNKTICHSGTFNFSNQHFDDKNYLIKKLKFLFNKNVKSTILFFSGHGQIDNQGLSYFLIESFDKIERLYYMDIYSLWKDRDNKDSHKYLLIVIDTCHSGGWVEENIHHLHSDIMIQASCKKDQTSTDLCYKEEKGGLLIYNLNCLNNKNLFKILDFDKQTPVCVGDRIMAKSIFGIDVLYNSWKEMKTQEYKDEIDRGNNLEKLGKYLDAIEFYNKAIQIDPSNPLAYNLKGISHKNLGQYHEAIECYDKAIQLNPKDSSSYNYKGNSLEKLGKNSEAIECYEIAIKLDPNNFSAHNDKELISKITKEIIEVRFKQL